ncbi:recombinase family protein [Bacillus cytotoxicus]|uniref:Recombinase family protein n=1 Tax=Bacillus cytotoxicus TaxID=580165 RepID=A0ACC6A9A1_9BACI|nr:recombinase family protein [Bacillus cytotoxicus]
MRYAVYVRVSTDRDEQVSSVENQIDICRYWIEKNGYEWDGNAVYFDDGISGTAWLERHAMQLILEKARKKELDTVVFKSIHRLARDLKDALEIKEILVGHGIRLVTIEEGYDSLYEGKNDMKFEMYAMFASQLPKTLSVSITAALTAKIRRGEYAGGQIPYGYDVVDKKYVINEEEKEVVLKIYELYEKGLGYIKVANVLNDMGYRTRNGIPWKFSAVQKIIRSAVYKGDHIMNKYTKIKVDGRKKQVLNPKEKWTVFENHHPAIIDCERWDKLNDPNRDNIKKRRVALENELRGIIFCSHCGDPMKTHRSSRARKKDGTVTDYVYMLCSRYRNSGGRECVRHKPILYPELRELVLYRLKEKESQLLDTDFYFDDENRYQEKVKKIEKDIRQIELKRERLLDLYLEGDRISKDVFSQRDKKLENWIREKELELLKLSDMEEQVKEKKEIKDAFTLLAQSDDLYGVFQQLISRIDMAQNGAVDIYYRFEV